MAMPWKNNSGGGWQGGGGGNRGPWGQGPSGGGPRPPHLEELVQNSQDRFQGRPTGDENIVDIHGSVLWTIKNAGDYLFKVQRPEVTVKAVAESVIREIVGKTPIQTAQTEGRRRIEEDTRRLTQKVLDEYGAGITI